MRVSTNQVSLDSGRMLVSWSFDAVSDKVRFVVNASEAVGWIGFGFALQAPNNMNDYDVIMAGYHDSQGGYIYVSENYARDLISPVFNLYCHFILLKQASAKQSV